MRLVHARRFLWKTKVQFQKVWQGQVRCKKPNIPRVPGRRTNGEHKVKPKTNAARASHPSRIVRRPSKAASPPPGATERRHRFSSARKSATLTVAVAQTAIQNRRSLTPAVASSPTPAQRAGGEEAAMPGQPVRTHAPSVSPGNSPSRITGFAASFAAIIVRRASRGPTFSVNSLCGRS